MKTCFLSIDVESSYARSEGASEDKAPFRGVEELGKILDIFKKHKANATLFVTGEVLEKYPNLVEKWAKDYEIGCHGYYHTTIDKLKLEDREKQLRDFRELYQNLFKSIPQGFRAPRNIIDNKQFLILKEYGFLYDASIFPRYPWWKKRYAGYKGKKPVLPYYLNNKLVEIPESPASFSIPLVGTWIRKSSVLIYKILFSFKRPKFISFNMHSWDSIEEKYLKQLDEMLEYLKKIGYKFKSGEEIYESFSAQGGPASGWQKINKKEYKELFEKAEFKTFFHNLEWHDFLEREFKWLRLEYYLYKNKTIFPLARAGKKLISLPFCEYGGPLGDFDEKDILEEFKNIKVKVHPKIKTGESDVSTYWIEDLKNKSKQELLGSFRKTLRHSIRNAQKHGLEIKKCPDESRLRKFYNLYVANLKKKKTVPYPFSVIKFLHESSDSELLIAQYKGKIVAGDMFLHYDKFVHYFLSASDYKYRNLGANYLILWEKIKRLLGKDVVFDFGAAPKGSALETFKRGWRGREYPILQLGIKRTDESLRSSKLRNIFGLLPAFIIKKLSPYLIKYRI